MLDIMKKTAQIGLAGAIIAGIALSGNTMLNQEQKSATETVTSDISAVALLNARESVELERASQQDIIVPETKIEELDLGRIMVTSAVKPKPKPKPKPKEETVQVSDDTQQAPSAPESTSKGTELDDGEVVGIPSRYVAAGRTGITATPSDPSNIRVATVTNENDIRNQIITDAKAGLGTPYVWGGISPTKGWDCSGYVQHIFKKSGIPLSRVDAWANFRQVSAKDAKPGDLVVQHNGAHVGIYGGNGKMYHAANPSRGTIYSSAHYATPTFYQMIVEK